MSKQLPPDPQGMNHNRSMWAGAALEEFQRQIRVVDEDALTDLLCDLMHLCDRSDGPGFDFEEQLERARRNYAEETGSD